MKQTPLNLVDVRVGDVWAVCESDDEGLTVVSVEAHDRCSDVRVGFVSGQGCDSQTVYCRGYNFVSHYPILRHRP